MIEDQTSTDPFSLESMLDTLTCVVGVLIVIMAVTQLLVLQQATRADLGATPVATINDFPAEEEIQTAHDELDRLNRELEEAYRDWSTLESDYVTHRSVIDELTKAIQQHRDDLAKDAGLESKAVAIADEIASLTRDDRSLKEAITAVGTEIAKLQEQLETTKPATEILLPERRRIEQDLESVSFVCRNGHIYPFDVTQLASTYNDTINDGIEEFRADMTTPERIASLVDFFGQRKVGNDLFRITLRNYSPEGQFKGLIITTEPIQSSQGESMTEMREADSDFQRRINSIDTTKQLIRFLVWADSFDTYLQARQIATTLHEVAGENQTRIALSWIPYDMEEEIQEFWDVLELNKDAAAPRPKLTGTMIDN